MKKVLSIAIVVCLAVTMTCSYAIAAEESSDIVAPTGSDYICPDCGGTVESVSKTTYDYAYVTCTHHTYGNDYVYQRTVTWNSSCDSCPYSVTTSTTTTVSVIMCGGYD